MCMKKLGIWQFAQIKNRVKAVTILLVTIAFLTACTDTNVRSDGSSNSKTRMGQIIGGALGAIIGAGTAKDGKDRWRRAIAGAALGATAGHMFGRHLDRRDRIRHQQARAQALRTGMGRWYSSDTGNMGEIRVNRNMRNQRVVATLSHDSRVASPRHMVVIGKYYKTNRFTQVRSGPSMNYPAIASLAQNSVVLVSGRLTNSPRWYLVSQGGVGVGYIHARDVRRTNQRPTNTVQFAKGKVIRRQIQATTHCKGLSEKIIMSNQGGRGTSESQNMTMCQEPSGNWEIMSS